MSTGTRPRVRRAVSADVDTVAWIHHTARTAYYSGSRTAHATGRPTREAVQQWRAAVVLPEPSGLWLAEFGDEPVGFVGYRPAEPPDPAGTLELPALYVLPHLWGHGTGDVLHQVFLDRLVASGRVGLLTVWDGNTRARTFYERHGWTLDGRARPGPRGTSYLGMRLVPDGTGRVLSLPGT